MKKLIPRIIGMYLNTLSLVAPKLAARQGFRVFCYPQRAPLQQCHHKFFNSASKSWIKYGDEQVQVYKWGSGRNVILFLHGWQSHSFRWKSYVERLLQNDVTIYALDAPGHGLSKGSQLTVPLYAEIVTQFVRDIGQVHAVVAHSLGAFTVLFMQHKYPLLPIRKIVLLASPGEASEFFDSYRRTLGLSSRAAKLIRRRFESVIESPVDYFSAPTFAESLLQPGLLIHDEHDEETSVEHSKNIHKAWKRSQLVITQGLGHNLKAPVIVEQVANFVLAEQEIPARMAENDF